MSKIELNIYTDGSYSTKNSPERTFGAYTIPEYPNTATAFCTTVPEAVRQRNVGGELLAAMCALKFACIVADKAKESGDEVICNLWYDYQGVGDWLLGKWKTKNPLTKGYVKYVSQIFDGKDNIKLSLNQVPGHSGIKGNEDADDLASKAWKNPDTKNMDIFIESVLKLGR